MDIQLKKVEEDDFDFAFKAKKDAMGPHIISKWGWDEDYQLETHKARWVEKPWYLIIYKGKAVGTVSLWPKENRVLRFGEFYLLGPYRRKGIGTRVLEQVLAKSDKEGKKVVLEYLKWNPVGALYKRFGFKITSENEIHYFMERQPNY